MFPSLLLSSPLFSSLITPSSTSPPLPFVPLILSNARLQLKTTEQELTETRRQLHELAELHNKCHTLLEVEQQRYYKKAYNNQQSAEQTRCMQLEKDKEVEVERIRHYKNQLAAEQARCMQLEKDKVRLVQDNNNLCVCFVLLLLSYPFLILFAVTTGGTRELYCK